MKKIILSVAILSLFVLACKKKKDDPAPTTTTKTTAQYLTAHTWKTSGAVSNVPIDADDDSSTPNTTDIWGSEDACDKDDVVSFAANGTGTYTDAGITCSSTTVQNFTWALSNNVITISFTGGSQTLTIVSVDDNTLKIALPADTDDNNVSYIETDTYSK